MVYHLNTHDPYNTCMIAIPTVPNPTLDQFTRTLDCVVVIAIMGEEKNLNLHDGYVHMIAAPTKQDIIRL